MQWRAACTCCQYSPTFWPILHNPAVCRLSRKLIPSSSGSWALFKSAKDDLTLKTQMGKRCGWWVWEWEGGGSLCFDNFVMFFEPQPSSMPQSVNCSKMAKRCARIPSSCTHDWHLRWASRHLTVKFSGAQGDAQMRAKPFFTMCLYCNRSECKKSSQNTIFLFSCVLLLQFVSFENCTISDSDSGSDQS